MKRPALWAAFVVALLAAMFTLLAAISALSEVVSGHLHRGDTLGSAIAAAVVLVLVTAAFAVAAWLAEHRARHLGGVPVAAPAVHPEWAPPPAGGTIDPSYEGPVRAQPSPSPSRPAPGEPSPTGPNLAGPPAARARSRPRHTPASHISSAVILAAFAAGCGFGSIAIFHDWRQSVATQNNGVKVAAVVVATDEVRHSTRSGSYETTNLTVQYPAPVDGHTQGLIVAPQDELHDGVGTVVPAVVDRSDPSHVELQGVAGTSGSEFALFAALTVIFLLLGARAVRAYRRLEARASST